MSTLYRWRDKDPKFAQAWTNPAANSLRVSRGKPSTVLPTAVTVCSLYSSRPASPAPTTSDHPRPTTRTTGETTLLMSPISSREFVPGPKPPCKNGNPVQIRPSYKNGKMGIKTATKNSAPDTTRFPFCICQWAIYGKRMGDISHENGNEMRISFPFLGNGMGPPTLQRLPHLDMLDARLHEKLALFHVPLAAVEVLHVGLGV